MPSRTLSIALALAAVLSAVYAGEVQSPPSQPAPRPTMAAPQAPAADADAQKHLKRTACLKDARARKLVGAQRTAFVKGCLQGTSEN